MADKPTPEKPVSAAPSREDRLKAALKANLARRKAQSRARRAGQGMRADQDGPGGQDKEK